MKYLNSVKQRTIPKRLKNMKLKVNQLVFFLFVE